MGVAAVFIDGGYVDKVRYYDFGNRRIDFETLAAKMAEPDELLRAHYYHCLPYQSNPPTDEERGRYASMHRFVTALNHLPRFEVRLGRLAKYGDNYVQKRVDCMVGVDMALLAGKRVVQRVVLLSGDSDLIPAIEAVKREGVLVTLWHGTMSGVHTRPSRDLYELCDERIELTGALFREIERR